MFDVLDNIKELPINKPHYLMGVGTPSDILGAVKEALICLTVFYLLGQGERVLLLLGMVD